ncbi:MAG TPA: hypothetical protein VHM88_03295 [Candidatus Acidoferrales bacterium]|nr:hypothetical protein [Candidatus Acidoferrales bacterium]
MEQLKEASDALRRELAAEVVRRFGRVRLLVSGISMVPAVLPGDLISVERAGVEGISPGEIALFARAGRLIAHRVVDRAGSPGMAYLVTRGDRMRRNDTPILPAELLGRVTSVERGQRLVPPHRWLRRPERMLCRLLRFSDRATSVYLRLRRTPAGAH